MKENTARIKKTTAVISRRLGAFDGLRSCLAGKLGAFDPRFCGAGALPRFFCANLFHLVFKCLIKLGSEVLRRGFLSSGGVEKPREGLVAFQGFAAPHGGKKTGGILWVLA